MKRVFLSFHYSNDSWRVQQIKNIGSIEEQPLLSYNEWEEIKRGGDDAIKRWISSQMDGKSCTIVLIGSATANRKWINYEISRSWDNGKPVVGIYVHKLKDSNGSQSNKGENPFKYIKLKNGKTLDQLVPCFDPAGSSSTEAYDWIKNNIEAIVDKAVRRSL
jgi:hypothetical protein